MLHELLLVLNCHSSSIFIETPTTTTLSPTFPNVHPSERALLNSLAHLAHLHRRTRDAIKSSISSHPSTIVRAVASAIDGQLKLFQQRVVDCEKAILSRDVELVGGYDIVPLAKLATWFSGWDRILAYVEELATFISLPERTGVEVLNRLKGDTRTGFPELRQLSNKFLVVAEQVWLKFLMTWVLYGKVSNLGSRDLFVKEDEKQDLEERYAADEKLIPWFLSKDTADSVLFIGFALVRTSSHLTNSGSEILHAHSALLRAIEPSIQPSTIDSTIAAVRASISNRLLRRLLPSRTIISAIGFLRKFMLLGDGKFMVALMDECEKFKKRRLRGMGNGVIRQGEVSAVLKRAMVAMRAGLDDDDEIEEDEGVDASDADIEMPSGARAVNLEEHLSLEVLNIDPSSTSFSDFLIGHPASLTLRPPFPLSLFLTTSDIVIYGSLFSFLASIVQTLRRLQALYEQRRVRTHVPLAVWGLIAHATFFWREVWGWMQYDVINPLYDEFINIEEQSDPETVRLRHTKYLRRLNRAFFGHMPRAQELLRSIHVKCEILSGRVVHWSEEDGVEDIEALGRFKKECSEFVGELESAGMVANGVGTEEEEWEAMMDMGLTDRLLLRLDWFSGAGHDAVDDEE
ncbi:hypothetical protein SAICODRAFT_70522 [Saitoella complicata NRRL Y-17804]|uniref:Spindle pole body component n=1 Tax=Saitoella complicata (strain BCRC 22490 / CBS 7301 / JCM 7358 / NBRC 10748 / NRRL Y-17804) TaxID=698492 RepID=A0A0E9NAY0_SAICN|nr:uncharacterized protein SAICODRAFT_70522 [Saitoella complicata NRRL Y-17804]ODQ53815.1 hypothetical protein SAICODRAFT_70522 [Saitoella complicata NRRL Y-17804]GAO46984.1 hypothetical protein G7K_1198-t1 [Saitoella complicata NRRL Y-17804]